MPQMHEWESRLRNLERNVNDIWTFLGKLADQVGKATQDLMMGRNSPGSGSGQASSIQSAVVTTTITAAPNSNTAGQGVVTLRTRTGASLANGRTGLTVYSNFSTAVASGKRVVVAVRGDEAELLGADCP